MLNEKDKLARLQVLRLLLALMVVIHHVFAYGQIHRQFPLPEWPMERFGQIGVIGFFVLSGYVVSMTLFASEAKEFLIRRLLRIFPALWLTILLVVAIKLTIFGSFPYQAYSWQALLLIPSGQIAYPLGVEWSLVYELFYYCLLGLIAALGLKQWLGKILLFWIALIIGTHSVLPDSTTMFPEGINIFLSSFNVAFALGALVRCYQSQLRKIRENHFGACVFAGLTGFAVFSIFTANWLAFAGLSLAFAVLILILANSQSALGEIGALAARMGDGSYGLYLLHAPVIEICMIRFSGPSFQNATSLMMGIGILATVSGVIWGVCEYKVYRRLTRIFSSKRKPLPPSPNN